VSSSGLHRHFHGIDAADIAAILARGDIESDHD
jgi:hypothetical protein